MKKSKYPNLNPCALGATLGLLYGLDLLLHAWSDYAATSFLWYTQTSNQFFLSTVPGYVGQWYCIPWAAVWGLLVGAVLGYVAARIYNCVNTKWGSPFCK